MGMERESPPAGAGAEPYALEGGAIRTMREAQKLTQRELAALAGTSHSYLSEIENGLKEPTPEIKRRILDALIDNLRGVA